MSMSISPSKENESPIGLTKKLEQEAHGLHKQFDMLNSENKYHDNFLLPLHDRENVIIQSALVYSEKASDINDLVFKTLDLSIHEDSQINQQQIIDSLLTKARQLFEAGKTADSLEKAKTAYAIVPDPKIAKKIKRIEAVLASEIGGESLNLFANTGIATEIQASITSDEQTIAESNASPGTSVKVEMITCNEEVVTRMDNSQERAVQWPHSQATAPIRTEVSNKKAIKEANELLTRARFLYEEGDLAESLRALQEAYNLDPNPKTERKIARFKAALAVVTEDKVEAEVEAAQAACTKLDAKARALFECKDYRGTLDLLLQADALCPSDKLKRRIGRLQNFIEEEREKTEANSVEEDEVDDDMEALTRDTANLSLQTTKSLSNKNVVELVKGFFLPLDIHEKLYPYQRDGVSWLYNLHKTAPGGILADDMGLGKTLQTIAFLTGYYLSEDPIKKPQTTIILAPVSVIRSWQSEFAKWSPSMRLLTYYEIAKSARRQALLSVQSRGGILLTTYNMLVSGIQDIAADQNYCRTKSSNWLSSVDPHLYARTFTYDYVILDEAHRIKNPSTQIAKAVRNLDCRHRLLLTGTAVQNNLRELWSLFDFTHEGRLLGSQKTFLLQYEKAILRSRERDASASERLHGNLMAESLTKIIRPFLLRRTKRDTLAVFSRGSMPRKNEIVVWVYLSSLQEHIYRSFLKLDHVKELLFGGTTRRSPLVELTLLKKLCDHPRLLSTEQCANLGLDVSKSLPGSDIRAPSYGILVEESGKVNFVVRLLEHFQEEALRSGKHAHRTLVFSQSLRLLNMTEAAILGRNHEPDRPSELPKHRLLRLDGRCKKLDERMKVLKDFAEDLSYTAMLLTTQVGGVGLTITSADRVVIFDPSWNPSVDAQAVDRIYRIGQHSDVVVYRLITCATVEEKIYRRQVFKDSVIRRTIDRVAADRPANADSIDPYRYFTREELVELFSLDENARFSATQRQLEELHSTTERRTYPELESHLNFLKSMTDVVFDISDHDLLFSRREDEKFEEENVAERLFAENRLKLGEAAIKMEAAGDFEGAKKIQQQAFISSKPTYGLPVDKIFIPSKSDIQRAVFNAPGCGKTDHSIEKHFLKTDDAIPSKFFSKINPTQNYANVGEQYAQPSSILPSLKPPEGSSSPVTSRTSASTDVIDLDLTQTVSDTEVDELIQRVSFRKSLAGSGIYLGEVASPSERDNLTKDDNVITDSCFEVEDETSVVEVLSDSVVLIEASISEDD